MMRAERWHSSSAEGRAEELRDELELERGGL